MSLKAQAWDTFISHQSTDSDFKMSKHSRAKNMAPGLAVDPQMYCSRKMLFLCSIWSFLTLDRSQQIGATHHAVLFIRGYVHAIVCATSTGHKNSSVRTMRSGGGNAKNLSVHHEPKHCADKCIQQRNIITLGTTCVLKKCTDTWRKRYWVRWWVLANTQHCSSPLQHRSRGVCVCVW